MGNTLFNDDGYDQFPFAENNDPMAAMEDYGLIGHAEEAVGPMDKVTPRFGPSGIGAPSTMYGREPMLEKAETEVNHSLKQLGCQLFLVALHRTPRTSANGFADQYWRAEGGKPTKVLKALEGITVEEFLKKSRDAKSGFLPAAIKQGSTFRQIRRQLMKSHIGKVLKALAAAEEKSVEDLVYEYLKYEASLRPGFLPFDPTSPAPHPSGGSLDTVLADLNGVPLFMGSAPEDGGTVLSKLEAFEELTLEQYRQLVLEDTYARWYIKSFYDTEVPEQEMLDEAKRNRRILYHAMTQAGGTGYNEAKKFGEYWHWQLGRRTDNLGNTCHNLLLGTSQPAIWSSAFANAEVARLAGRKYVF